MLGSAHPLGPRLHSHALSGSRSMMMKAARAVSLRRPALPHLCHQRPAAHCWAGRSGEPDAKGCQSDDVHGHQARLPVEVDGLPAGGCRVQTPHQLLRAARHGALKALQAVHRQQGVRQDYQIPCHCIHWLHRPQSPAERCFAQRAWNAWKPCGLHVHSIVSAVKQRGEHLRVGGGKGGFHVDDEADQPVNAARPESLEALCTPGSASAVRACSGNAVGSAVLQLQRAPAAGQPSSPRSGLNWSRRCTLCTPCASAGQCKDERCLARLQDVTKPPGEMPLDTLCNVCTMTWTSSLFAQAPHPWPSSTQCSMGCAPGCPSWAAT